MKKIECFLDKKTNIMVARVEMDKARHAAFMVKNNNVSFLSTWQKIDQTNLMPIKNINFLTANQLISMLKKQKSVIVYGYQTVKNSLLSAPHKKTLVLEVNETPLAITWNKFSTLLDSFYVETLDLQKLESFTNSMWEENKEDCCIYVQKSGKLVIPRKPPGKEILRYQVKEIRTLMDMPYERLYGVMIDEFFVYKYTSGQKGEKKDAVVGINQLF